MERKEFVVIQEPKRSNRQGLHVTFIIVMATSASHAKKIAQETYGMVGSDYKALRAGPMVLGNIFYC